MGSQLIAKTAILRRKSGLGAIAVFSLRTASRPAPPRPAPPSVMDALGTRASLGRYFVDAAAHRDPTCPEPVSTALSLTLTFHTHAHTHAHTHNLAHTHAHVSHMQHGVSTHAPREERASVSPCVREQDSVFPAAALDEKRWLPVDMNKSALSPPPPAKQAAVPLHHSPRFTTPTHFVPSPRYIPLQFHCLFKSPRSKKKLIELPRVGLLELALRS